MDCVVDSRRYSTLPDDAPAAGARRPPGRIDPIVVDASMPLRRDDVRPLQPVRWQRRFGGLLIAVAVNVVAVVPFLWTQPLRILPRAPEPLQVSVLTLPTVHPPAPPVSTKPPKPRVQQHVAPLVTTPPPIEPVPETVPEPLVAIAPSPQAITVAQAPPAPITPAPVPVTPPSFNADYLQNPSPVYPPASRRLGEQGKVVLRVLVSAAGAPDKVELRTSCGFDRLDQAALDVVARWRFVPARLGDVAVQGWVLIPISFVLKA